MQCKLHVKRAILWSQYVSRNAQVILGYQALDRRVITNKQAHPQLQPIYMTV